MRHFPQVGLSLNRRGVVLFLVVGIVLILTLLTYGFLIAMRTQNLSAAQYGDRLQARQAAFSARELVCTILEAPWSVRSELHNSDMSDDGFGMIQFLAEDEQPDEFTSCGFVVSDLDSKQFGYGNESSKINLAVLLAADADNPGWGREVLIRLPGMSETTADRILDWMDADDEPREFGAESEFYFENGMTPPRNSVPPDLSELALIPEVNLEMIQGKQSYGPSGESEGNKPLQRNLNEQTDKPWSHFLTVKSGERNESFNGQARIFLNESDLFELHSKLAEASTVEIANYVVLARQYGFASSTDGAISSSPSSARAAGQIQIDFTQPGTYEFESTLDILNSTVQVGGEDADPSDSNTVKSPLTQTATTLDDITIRFLDVTTTTSSSVIDGRVNLLQASRQVLLSIPELDESLVDQIIANRESQQNTSKNCFWLLENGLVTMELMKQIESKVTSRGEISRFFCGGWSDQRSAPVVYEVILDATTGTARQIQCRRILETASLKGLSEKNKTN